MSFYEIRSQRRADFADRHSRNYDPFSHQSHTVRKERRHRKLCRIKIQISSAGGDSYDWHYGVITESAKLVLDTKRILTLPSKPVTRFDKPQYIQEPDTCQ